MNESSDVTEGDIVRWYSEAVTSLGLATLALSTIEQECDGAAKAIARQALDDLRVSR